MKLKKLTAAFLVIGMTFASVNVTLGDWSETDYVYDNGQVTMYINETTGALTRIDPDDYEAVVDLDIPSEINGITVTSIDAWVYSYRNSLSKITLPNTITSIGDCAFRYTSFDSIVLPDSLTTIGALAFMDWTSQTVSEVTVTIPKNVTSIGDAAFTYSGVDDSDLTAIYVDENNKYYNSLDGILFNKDLTEILIYPPAKTDSSYIVPDNVTSIGAYAFTGYNLKNIRIPENVTNIDENAFKNYFHSAADLETVYCYKNSAADNASLYADDVTIIYLDENTTTETSTETTTEVATETSTETTTEAATETTTKKSSSGSSSSISHSSSGGSSYVGGSKKTSTSTADTDSDAADSDSTANTDSTASSPSAKRVTEEVRVSIGSTEIVVGDKSYSTDAAPYIQSESNSTLIPLRVVSLAILGGDVESADTSEVIAWDAATKTATIYAGDEIIIFTADSNIMTVNGKEIAMDNNVKAEISDGRMYIPFRALGKAFGVDVDWDSDSKTAIYKAM